MENSETQSVKVAVNIRPLVTPELLVGCTDCITVYPAQKQVQIGSHAFTFDCIFGSKGSSSSHIYEECVSPLVDAIFQGYNGTVLAYGQTGSGKTYTMGTNYNGEDHSGAVIPRVMDSIFSKVGLMKEEGTEFLIRVSFIEIFKEDVFDLLYPMSKSEGPSTAKATGPSRAPIQIRETTSGGITLSGVTEVEVKTKEEMGSYLLQGSFSRATGSTNMNSQSSRSHAIFTISMEQRRMTHSSAGDDIGDDILSAKLHLVDLAGSERAKRTGADGTRLQEGIHINRGLLALGNVISALGDDKKRKGGHVPYRDSKLTRILQDSLGGNSKTIMIACVSPADTNAEETLNTLKYANRARNIQNKAIVNRDPVASQMQTMKSQIEQLQAELLYYRGNSSAPPEEIGILKHKISLLEANKTVLQEELRETRTNNEHLTQRAIDAQVEKDILLMKLRSTQNGKPTDDFNVELDKDFDVMKGYITKIHELEGQLHRMQNANHPKFEENTGYLALDYIENSDLKIEEKDASAEDVEKEIEHSSLQEKLDRELKELDKKLEEKEAEMKRFTSTDTSVIKQHYEKKVHDLELEKRALHKEIDGLRQNLASISSNSDDSAQKLKEEYLEKLNLLETQVAELKKKQDSQAQLLRQKQKSDEAARRLNDEIHRIKTQKVQLQQKIKQESEQFRMWKASREKEVLQLKKEGRRNEYEMHKLLALNQKQKMVLQRKTEEAAMATKRLKDLIDSRKASRGDTFGPGNKNSPGIQALTQAIEHELEVIVRVHEVRAECERQRIEKTRMGEELAKLKEEALIAKNSSVLAQTMSPGARNSRIFALQNMIATSSSALVSMASQLSEAEECERAFSGKGRWSQIRSMAEAKAVMTFLLNVASSSRCHLRDREVDCREKDSEIRDLKEKVVNLFRQMEMQKTELNRQEKFMKAALKRRSAKMRGGSGNSETNTSDGHAYDLRPKGSRTSTLFEAGWYDSQLLEDMDTSDDEWAEETSDLCDDVDDSDFELTREKRKRQTRNKNSKTDNLEIVVLDSNEPTQSASSKGVSCCTCSKYSTCKTSKCECRAEGGNCNASCSCSSTKCSNREGATEDNLDLASRGAMLLQNALSENVGNVNDGGLTVRKALSDIGNKNAVTSESNPAQRKKWRKPVIQLVPSTPTIPETEDSEAVLPPINDIRSDIQVKLPRIISNLTENTHLKDRNSDQPLESVDKESSLDKSPHREARGKKGKENKGL